MKVLLSQMTHREVAEVLERPNVAVLPVGSTEQHGPHLPLDVDTRIAASMCESAARAIADEVAVVVAPALPFGISEHHMAFPGTVTLDATTFISVVYQVGQSLVRHGFDRLVIVNGHGGNVGALQIIGAKLRFDAGARHVVYFSEWALAADAFASMRDSGPGGASHACEYETSLYLHLQPELVQMEHARREMPPPLISGAAVDLFESAPYEVAMGHDLSTSGALGDPTVANEHKGAELFETAVLNLTEVLRQVARLSPSGTPRS